MKQFTLLLIVSFFLFSCKKNNTVEYPKNGAFGVNILNIDNTDYTSNNYSLAANLSKKASLKLKIISTTNGIWFYELGSEHNWAISTYNGTQTFTSENKGLTCDLNIEFISGVYLIEYYENDDSSPTFTRTIIKL